VSLLRLQRAAGNRAVSALVAQRLAKGQHAGHPSGGTGGRAGPGADPKFAALRADVHGKQKLLGAHPPPAHEARASQAAAKPPPDDKEAQGKVANANTMNAAKPGEFDKAAFIRAVNQAIAAQAPKNLDEADKFAGSGKADAVKGQVQGQVSQGKTHSAAAIDTATKAPPDISAAKEKPVTPLAADHPPATPGAPNPNQAVPDKAPASATDSSAGPAQADHQMAQAHVTDEQLAKSNEPQFTHALQEKKAGERHAATAPGTVRTAEAHTLNAAKAHAAQVGATAMNALAGHRRHSGAQVTQGKHGAKGRDESARAQVTAKLQTVFNATKSDVEQILSGLDRKVDEAFSKGERAAREAFTADHKRRMDAYKHKRYSGGTGKLRWLKDKFAGLPEEANQIFVQARQGYVNQMQQVISGVADIIGAELGRAKQRIAAGRAQLQAEVHKLPANLQAIGREAAADFAGKFDELTETVNNKSNELVQTLANKYTEALKAVDAEIAKEKEKNKGLVAKAVGAVKGVIDTIMHLKDMLLGVLRKAAQAVMAIIKDPIGFLKHLVSAVGAGLRQFLGNIGQHLKRGLIGWLTGAMAGAGLELPSKFDLRGIVMMIGSLLGLTWAAIRARIVKRGIPEPAMVAVEKSVPLVQKVRAEGLGGLWEEIKGQVADLKENLFSKIAEYLIPTVLIAGITWIISLLNPASAFVRAVKMIIDFVSFVINQGAQILEFVNAVLEAIIAIAGGGTGGVPALIENALARSIPVLIGVLAAILGIGGIAEKVKKLFRALSKPVMKAVDWVVGRIVALAKKILARIRIRRGNGHKKDDLAGDIQQRWRRGLAGIRAIGSLSRRGGLEARGLLQRLANVKAKYGFQELYAYRRGVGWAVYAKLNPDNRGNLVPVEGKALLVGEGNLTFTGSIIVLGINIPGNLTATVYEREDEKSEETRQRAGRLRQQGVTVEFGVDATRLHEGPTAGRRYDTIVWMFPHPGGRRADVASRGAALLTEFFQSAARHLNPEGRIVVTLRLAAQPNWYVNRWRPVEAAAAAGLRCVSRDSFGQEDYPGYTHETTDKGANRADVTRGYTFVFTR